MNSTIIALISCVLIASTAQLFFKKGVLLLGDLEFSGSGFLDQLPNALKNPWLMGGALLFLVGFIFYAFVLSKIQLNIAYPILTSMGIILVALGSWAFLGEVLSWHQIIGIALIISGIFLLVPR